MVLALVVTILFAAIGREKQPTGSTQNTNADIPDQGQFQSAV